MKHIHKEIWLCTPGTIIDRKPDQGDGNEANQQGHGIGDLASPGCELTGEADRDVEHGVQAHQEDEENRESGSSLL